MAAGKGGVERSGVVAIVPTTAGAIQLMGLRWSQRIPSSRVVLANETSDQAERWTKDYNSLLRPGDPMRTLLGLPESGGCRLVVSAEIDHGRSWIVPVAAAHFADARAQAVHADMARARMMIWGTGAIDFSQPETAEEARIVENDYHLTAKIDLSRQHFAAAAHERTPVLCLLPAGPDAERAAGILRKVLGQQPHHVEIVKTLADVVRPIDAYLKKGDFTAPPDLKYAPAPYTPPPEAEEEERAEMAGSAAGSAARPTAAAEPPPVYGAKAPPPKSDRPLAGSGTGAKKGAGLPVGLIGGAAVALIAVVGVGALMLRTSPAPNPAPPPAPRPAAQTPAAPQPSPPQVVTVAPTPQASGGPPSAAPVIVTAPLIQPPPTPQPIQPAAPPGQPPQAIQPSSPPQPATAGPSQPAPAAPPVGRLTILTPPAGSTCQAQVLEMNPRFVETVVELTGAQPVLEIDTPALCGLAIAGAGTAQSRFAPGTVVGTVPSLSSGARIVFNPSGGGARLPDIAVSGGPIEKIELRRK